MIPALSSPRNRMRTAQLLAACVALAIGAAAVGIDDNLPGLLMGFLAAVALVLAVVHPWRSEEQYRYLLWGSLAGSMVLAFMHEGFEALAHGAAEPGAVQMSLSGFAVVCFLVVVVLGPPAFVVGLTGTIALAIRRRRHPKPPPAAV
jgi:hypothetical protein